MTNSCKNWDEIPVMMTVQELARFLRVSRNTAYNFVNEGKVPFVKIGHQIRIYRDDVIEYVKSQRS